MLQRAPDRASSFTFGGVQRAALRAVSRCPRFGLQLSRNSLYSAPRCLRFCQTMRSIIWRIVCRPPLGNRSDRLVAPIASRISESQLPVGPAMGHSLQVANDDVSFHSDQTRNAGIGRVVIQGISVLATRKPVLSFRKSTVFLMRLAARSCSGGLFQEPPRLIRRAQSSPAVHAVPSSGAPS